MYTLYTQIHRERWCKKCSVSYSPKIAFLVSIIYLFSDGVFPIVCLEPLVGLGVVLVELLGNVGTDVPKLLLWRPREMEVRGGYDMIT